MLAHRGLWVTAFAVACGAQSGIGEESVSTGAGGSLGGVSPASGGAQSCLDTTVAFKVRPPTLLSGPGWCFEFASNCGLGEIFDAVGPLALQNDCTIDCNSCAPSVCNDCVSVHSYLFIHNDVLTVATWDGTYYTTRPNTCSSTSTTCAEKRCAAPGDYSFRICGSPSPGSGDADCSQIPSGTASACQTVDFRYPEDTVVVVTMPSE